MNEIIITKTDIISAFAYWILRQSPYDVPNNLESILKEIADKLDNSDIFKDNRKKSIGNNEYITLLSLSNLIKDLTFNTSVQKLNITKVELDNGIVRHDDPERTIKFDIVSRYGNMQEEDKDFIDLDALCRNVSNMIVHN